LNASFLYPEFNHRNDDFGGDDKKRCEIIRRIIVETRKNVPSSFCLSVKMNGATKGPLRLPEDAAVTAAKVFEESGIDAIEVAVASPLESEPPDVSVLSAVKKAVKIPVKIGRAHV
jgi:2,4-dienoyl-CoA reductase-like NADH-dependent reductase (Old Yellow Enzyme family)